MTKKANRLSLQSVFWTIQQCAEYAGVSVQTYRRRIQILRGHPYPLDTGQISVYLRDEVKTFLDDPKNLRPKPCDIPVFSGQPLKQKRGGVR